jgi:hypothetical protein
MFFRAGVLLPAISLSLKIRGFRATQQALQKFSIPSKSEKRLGERVMDGERVNLAVRMVNAAGRYDLGQASCLEKSLALWWLLRREGMASSVRIGARKSSGKFEAHAWVERDGVALNEPREEHRHYATFDAAFPLQSSETS